MNIKNKNTITKLIKVGMFTPLLLNLISVYFVNILSPEDYLQLFYNLIYFQIVVFLAILFMYSILFKLCKTTIVGCSIILLISIFNLIAVMFPIFDYDFINGINIGFGVTGILLLFLSYYIK